MKTSDQTLRYNAKDAFITLECANAFYPEIDKPAYPGQPTFRSTYDHTIELFGPCMYMMGRGIKVNREQLKVESENVGKRIDELQEQINEKCGREINPNSPKDVQGYFYIEKGIPPYTKLNTKKERSITTDDKALQRIARGTSARRGYPEARLMQEWRKLRKLRGTYLEISFDSDNRLRCDYKPRGTRFARLSSAKTVFDTGMNMQNLDPAFLSFLEADEGCVFMDLDKKQAEWVVVAYSSGDQNMINAVESGADVHAYTASQMFHQPQALIQEEDTLLGHDTDPDQIYGRRMHVPELKAAIETNSWLPRTMSMRQCGKKSNHGLNYEETYKRFALENEITEKEGKVIVEFYHETYPGIRLWYEHIRSRLSSNGRVLTNLFGRPYRFLGKWDQVLFKAAYSFIPQSTVGELLNRGMCDIYYSRSPGLQDAEILRQVHDNITLQSPLDSPVLGESIRESVRCLNPTLTAGGREFEIGTELKVGVNLKDMVKVPLVDDPSEQARLIRKAVNGQAPSR